MRRAAKAQYVIEFTQKAWWSGCTFRLVPIALKFLGFAGAACRALLPPLSLFKKLSNWMPAHHWLSMSAPAKVTLTIDERAGWLNLNVTNRADAEIWAEEARIDLVDLETEGEQPVPAQAVVKIQASVARSETLHASLMGSVYDAMGLRQEVHSCLISGVLRYQSATSRNPAAEQKTPWYRAEMIALVPVSLRRIGFFDTALEAKGNSAVSSREQMKRVRRSMRVTKRATVVVGGTFANGSEFSDAADTLVLSAHGCLITFPIPLEMGGRVLLRNLSTLQEQRCQVVYVGPSCGAGVQLGLAFENEAREFWGVEYLPAVGVPV